MAETAQTRAAKQQARSAAERRLREAHEQQFADLLAEEMGKAGVDWKPRLSDRDKAAAKIRELLAAFPDLEEQFK